MKFPEQDGPLRINLDTKNCSLSGDEIAKMEAGLAPLRKPIEDFPVADLYLNIIFHARSNNYHVKTALVLSGRTLFTGDRDDHIYPAFERCVNKLLKKIAWYKRSLAGEDVLDKHRKGTHQSVVPTQQPDGQLLAEAVESGDYVQFRTETFGYEESIRKRAGRWVERYPELQRRIPDELQLDDVVEEVFLTAFDRWDRRPDEVRFGEWLEGLIDPAVKALIRHPDEAKENIDFVRTLRQARPAD